MGKFRGARHLLCLALFFGVFGGLFESQLALAAQKSSQADVLPPPGQEEPLPEEATEDSLEVFSSYPVLQNVVGSTFKFEITLYYEGSEPKTFDLDVILPEGWAGVFTGGYPETEIPVFTVEPGKENETINLTVGSSSEDLPRPGEYVFTVRVAADDLTGSIDLKAVVVAAPPRYLLYMSTSTQMTEFQVKPNQDNHVSILLQNVQTGRVDNIIFTTQAPEGWDIIFTPSELASLESGVTQEIDLVIRPPAGTEAGDYNLIVKAAGDQIETERELRITVATSTAWGSAGIGIAIAIIVGLAIWFRQSGRRGEAETTGSDSWFKRAAARLRRSGSR